MAPFALIIYNSLAEEKDPAVDRDNDAASVASSIGLRMRLPRVFESELPDGSEIAEDFFRIGRGPGYKAILPAGMQTRSGETQRWRGFRDAADMMGARRTQARARLELEAWLNATYREGWIPIPPVLAAKRQAKRRKL